MSFPAMPLLSRRTGISILPACILPGWILAATLAVPYALADSANDEGEAESRFFIIWPRRAIGSWNDFQSEAQKRGIRVSLFLNHFAGRLQTGSEESSLSHSGSADIFLYFDLERMGLARGAEILVQAKSNSGRNINPPLAALSDPIDDADFSEPVYIDQLWYQQSFFQKQLQLRFGYLDLQTILDRNRYANSEDQQFLSTFLDNNNAILPLQIGVGATLFAKPSPWLDLRLGVADADNQIRRAGLDTAFDDMESLMAYLEAGFSGHLQPSQETLPGNYRFGVFWDARRRPVFGSDGLPPKRGDVGFYLSLDQQLIDRENRSLGIFFRYGLRDGKKNRIAHFWSTGLECRLHSQRPQDALGVGLYSARGSSQYRNFGDSAFSFETGLEVYYRFELTPWLALTPDFQFIENPGGDCTASDAWVLGLRTRLSF